MSDDSSALHPEWCVKPCDAYEGDDPTYAHRSGFVEVPTLGLEPLRLRLFLSWVSRPSERPVVVIIQIVDDSANDPNEPVETVTLSLRQAASLGAGVGSLAALVKIVRQRKDRNQPGPVVSTVNPDANRY